jgi:hypothetical protein
MFKRTDKKSSIEGVLELEESTLESVWGGAGEAWIEDTVVVRHLDDLRNARFNNVTEITYSVPVPSPVFDSVQVPIDRFVPR